MNTARNRITSVLMALRRTSHDQPDPSRHERAKEAAHDNSAHDGDGNDEGTRNCAGGQDTGRRRGGSGLRADLVAAGVALLLVAAANVVITVGHWYTVDKIAAWAPPLFASWHPHIGPGTLSSIVLAVAVIAYGPRLADRLRWSRLVALAYVGCVAWTVSVALVDGWQCGIASRVATPDEYLVDVPRITDIPQFLRTFTSHILAGHPGSWATHVSGHPPGATLVFVWLDRLGLGGGGVAAVACVFIGGLTAVAVPSTIRALGNETAARAAVPFLILLPGAGIAGVAADWLFAGISASGIALLAIGAARLRATRPRWPARAVAACLAAGLLLGFSFYLSYGLVLIALLALAVLVVARTLRPLAPALIGVVPVVAVFTAAGFWWPDGYHLLIQRYYQDVGFTRPYNYWVWANLACLVLAAGPALGAGLRRAAIRVLVMLRTRSAGRDIAVLALLAAVALIVAIADESGLTKAETERIWLPFTVWLIASASLLPARHRRWWLVLQVITALVVKNLLSTQW